MKFKTSISNSKNGEVFVRGQKLTSLIGKMTFTDAVYLVLRGKNPSKNQSAILDAILVSCIEHGVAAPSAFVPRVVASTGNDINVAIAAGALTISDFHGGAIERAMEMLAQKDSAKDIVANALSEGKRLSGLGHKVYKDADPRAKALFAIAKKLKLSGKFVKKAQDIEGELKKQKGTKLPINIDGAIAALLCELGFDSKLGKAFFILGRMPGMMAHALEEMTNEKPYRRLGEDEVEYTGK